MSPPRLFTIPASAPFLPTLVHALIGGKLVPGYPANDDPLALAAATLYLPTRRACRLARDMFLNAMDGKPAILPRIVPIGDVDEDEIAFAEAAGGALAAEALALPDALGGFERKMLLAQLILRWAKSPGLRTEEDVPLVANSPAAALALADDLARLFDDMTTRKVSWDKLDGLVPDEMDVYWQKTLTFLRIVRDQWPAILAAHGAIEPAERRDSLIAAEAERLKQHPGPVIAAGSTGSMPATATLLAAIAQLPQGAVVLPGLDTDLDAKSWDLISGDDDIAPAIGHPQFAMQALLRRMQVTRDSVKPLAAPAPHGREALVSEALRPAATTENWKNALNQASFITRTKGALDSLAVIEAANAEEEALAIAVALRETAETPGKTAALITPDRGLARRVLAALGRWKVPVDDSGGDSLADNAAGIFARLAAETALGGFEPVTLLALLKHSLFRLGKTAGAHDSDVSVLERAILRGPRPKSGSAGLAHALKTLRDTHKDLHWSDPRKTVSLAQVDRATSFVSALAAALTPLEGLERKPQSLAAIAARHRDAVTTLGDGDKPLFADRDGAALASAFEEMTEAGDATALAVLPSDYPELFRALTASRVVRRPGAPGSRVRIYGPLEARLQQADRVVLGGLIEGTWPPETRGDPWLSRPMRQELGLDLPERRIGLSAHDFAQSLGAREIILTRAAKVAGAPTVASRFTQRLAAVAGEGRWVEAQARGARYLDYARALDESPPERALQRPEPRPPRALRPKALTVTEIEDWLRDPYTIYAKHILRLAPLDPVDTPPGARDRGTVIHMAVGDFTKIFAKALPPDSNEALLKLGRKYFAPLDDYPEARAFWWPRFERIARWFADWESERRLGINEIQAETPGRHTITHAGGTFELRARADRIEILADGRVAIIDYKTGRAPTERQVRLGLSPQMTLEAAILRNGGFTGVAAGTSVAQLLYVRLRGGNPAGEPCGLDFIDGTPDSQADKALSRLTEIVAKFDSEEMPYRSLVHPMWKTSYGVYDHLARVKEWSAAGEDEDEVE